MRKISAVILLLSLWSLLVEWVATPSYCFQQATSNCRRSVTSSLHGECTGAISKHSDPCHTCCKQTSKLPDSKGKQPQSESGCIDCPLYYVMTFQPFCGFDYFHLIDKAQYRMMLVARLSDHPRQHWKPPNQYSI